MRGLGLWPSWLPGGWYTLFYDKNVKCDIYAYVNTSGNRKKKYPLNRLMAEGPSGRCKDACIAEEQLVYSRTCVIRPPINRNSP